MYIKRHAESAIEKLSKMFGAILVSGSRQVGKTTMLKNITHNLNYVSMDDIVMRASAIEHSKTFFMDNPPPIFIDEVQKAPVIFEEIKMIIDSEDKKGRFFMCGSQQLIMMRNVSESLAGRIGLITLLGLSFREINKIPFNEPFLPTDKFLVERKKHIKNIEYSEIWKLIQRGSIPELYKNQSFDWQMYYAAYVRTYIEIDVRDFTKVGDSIKFSKFMTAVAARTGQLLNLASISKDVGISEPTAERWLSILIASNIVYLLKPFSNNITKRVVKTPKLYFLDTGLAAYLTKWNTYETLKNGAMAGAFFETFVIVEIIKSYYNKGILDPPLYFYRDKDMNEIDLIIENDGLLHPIEIKKHAEPKMKDISNFKILDKISNKNRGSGGVISLYDKIISLSDMDKNIPVDYL